MTSQSLMPYPTSGGNPITVYRNEEEAQAAAQLFETRLPIICNGKVMMITANLHDALLGLRRLEVGGNKPFSEIGGKPRAKYWVDAMCINQNDIAERKRPGWYYESDLQ